MVYEDYALLHCHMFAALCLYSLQSSHLQSYSGAIVVSVTYYKQRIFREKAVIVQKCGTNGFVTLLYAFLQCNPYTGPWKLSPIEVLLSSSIKAMFAIELWCYTFLRLYPQPLRLVSYECTTTMAWVMSPKCLFLEQNHCFCGSCGGNWDLYNLNRLLLLLIPLSLSFYSNSETILQYLTGPII